MNVAEFAALQNQVARERKALDEGYVEFQKRMAEHVERAKTVNPDPKELIGYIALLGNFVNFERDHADKLYALLLDAMKRLAEAYDIAVPPGWPETPVA